MFDRPQLSWGVSQPHDTMDCQLSSYEFRAYTKASGYVSLYLRTQVLFATQASFSVEAYLKNITGTLSLAAGEVFPIGEGVSIGLWSSIKYDGHTQVHELSIPIHTRLTELRDGLGQLDLGFHFDFHRAEIHARHAHPVYIRRVRTPTYAQRLANVRCS